MKKTISFLIALVLFISTIGLLHIIAGHTELFERHAFGSWVNQTKIFSGESIKKNMNQDTMVVMGSSEFRWGRDMKSHPAKMFQDKKMNMMMIGAGYYQSLFHSVELSAIADGIQNKKVVLILSPQWFKKDGVVPEAYASRFPELNYIAMLKNENISLSTKQYMINRTEELLVKDPPTLKRVKAYNRIFVNGHATAEDKKIYQGFISFYGEKARLSLYVSAKMQGIETERSEGESEPDQEPDWNEYMNWAEEAGQKQSSNPFFVKDSLYQKQIVPRLESAKDSATGGNYGVSREYEDLRCFLQVCRDSGIKPMLVLAPVNGYWYDYTGFPESGRTSYYQNIRDIAAEYDAEVADLSDQEYTKYFFLDRVHFGWKGWVMINENIYKFAKQDN